nr:hypothetical protein [Candidatus Sigynarchaeota archaeon]
IAIAMLPRAVKTKNFYLYGLKVGLVFLIVFTGLVPNPLIWGSQIYRRLDHHQLLTPNEPSVRALNDTSNLWTYIPVTPEQFRTWSIPNQVNRIHWYIRSIIDYEYDIDNNYVFDHVATPREVLETRKDDCQGISCLIVSLLIYLGYDAWIAECPFHWYVRVFYTNSTNDTTFTDVYRSSSQPDPFYLFNEDTTVFPENIFWTINTSFTYDYIARKFLQIMNGTNGTLDLSIIGSSFPETNIPAWVAWIAIFGACALLGFLATIFFNISSYKRMKSLEKVASVFSFAVPLFIGFLSILFIPPTSFLYFALVMVGCSVFLADTGVILVIVRMIAAGITRLDRSGETSKMGPS